jgi:NADPH-dependent ferric siderophore reductase
MVRLEETSEHFLRRRYSVRSVDAAAANLTLWVSTTHEGAGARWASQIAVGDGVDMVGPRGKIALNPLADWHLFVGDTTALGAFYRMAESVEPPGQVIFIVEVDHLDDAVTPALADGLGVTAIFVDRAGRLGGDPTGLLRGLATFDTPLGDGQAYVFGELAAGHAVRTALLDRGLSNDQVSLKAFWRAGVHNAEHGEPPKD